MTVDERAVKYPKPTKEAVEEVLQRGKAPLPSKEEAARALKAAAKRSARGSRNPRID